MSDTAPFVACSAFCQPDQGIHCCLTYHRRPWDHPIVQSIVGCSGTMLTESKDGLPLSSCSAVRGRDFVRLAIGPAEAPERVGSIFRYPALVTDQLTSAFQETVLAKLEHATGWAP